MTEREARAVARHVVKTANPPAVVKTGVTNGTRCLHIRTELGSRTIYSGHDWITHPWNRENQKRTAEASAEVEEIMKNA